MASRGNTEEALAVRHIILVIAYHMLTKGTVDRDLGCNAFDERDRQAAEHRLVHRLVHRLEGLGYPVCLAAGSVEIGAKKPFPD